MYLSNCLCCCRFPPNPYLGENKERGQNGLYMYATSHSHISNVVFENADFGVSMDSCSFNTIQNVTFISNRPTAPGTNAMASTYKGSKGIWLKGTFDVLVKDFSFTKNYKYELLLSYFALGNVFTRGTTVDGTIELMYGAPYGNLFTDIDLGAATEPFGWVQRGQDMSSYNTFWNIRGTKAITIPPTSWAPVVNWVDVRGASMVSWVKTI
jgi:parallel beta-helix repeat protein